LLTVFVDVTVVVDVGVRIGGSAHRQPEEMPLELGRSAQVNGFWGAGSCLFALIAGGAVTSGDGDESSQTKDVDTLVLSARQCDPESKKAYAVATSVSVATVLVTVVDPV